MQKKVKERQTEGKRQVNVNVMRAIRLKGNEISPAACEILAE